MRDDSAKIVTQLEQTFGIKYKNFKRKQYIICKKICYILDKIVTQITEKATSFAYKNRVYEMKEEKDRKETEICQVKDCPIIFQHECILKMLNKLHFNFDIDDNGNKICSFILTNSHLHYDVADFKNCLKRLISHYYVMAYLDGSSLMDGIDRPTQTDQKQAV